MRNARKEALQWLYENGGWPEWEVQRTAKSPEGWLWRSNVLSSVAFGDIWEMDYIHYADSIRQGEVK